MSTCVNPYDRAYQAMERKILDANKEVSDRTGVGTLSVPGHYYSIEIRPDPNDKLLFHGFPLQTIKKMHLRGIFEELMWKLRGKTNIIPLLEKNVHIWTEWPFKKWLEHTGQINNFGWYVDDKKSDYSPEWKRRIEEFEQGLLDGSIESRFGELGPTYGRHFRNFGEVRSEDGQIIRAGVDQLARAIDKIENKPSDRRIIISLWDPHSEYATLLPPCPCFYQFFANQPGKLSLNMYQRSCDTFLGVPYNDAQDALFLILMSVITGREPDKFNHSFGDAHIYLNHQGAVETILSREPFPSPSIRIKRVPESITDFTWDDIELVGYQSHDTVRAPVAV